MGKGTRKQELRRKRHRREKALKLRQKMKLLNQSQDTKKA